MVRERCTNFREAFPRSFFNDNLIQAYIDRDIKIAYRGYIKSYLGIIYKLFENMATARERKVPRENIAQDILSLNIFFHLLNKKLLHVKRDKTTLSEITWKNFIVAINEFESTLHDLFVDYTQDQIDFLKGDEIDLRRFKSGYEPSDDSASEDGDFTDEQDAEIKKLTQMQEASQNIIKEREKTIADLNAKLLAYENKIANINKTFQIGIGVAAACAGVGVLFFKSFVGRNNSLAEQITQQATSKFQF